MSDVRVLAVEYRMRAVLSSGVVTAETTLARVMTPLGEQHVEVQGYHAERDLYAPLLVAALDSAWNKFCYGTR